MDQAFSKQLVQRKANILVWIKHNSMLNCFEIKLPNTYKLIKAVQRYSITFSFSKLIHICATRRKPFHRKYVSLFYFLVPRRGGVEGAIINGVQQLRRGRSAHIHNSHTHSHTFKQSRVGATRAESG